MWQGIWRLYEWGIKEVLIDIVKLVLGGLQE